MRTSKEIIEEIAKNYEFKRVCKNVIIFSNKKDAFYVEELSIDLYQRKYSKTCYDENFMFSPASISMKENNLIYELFQSFKKEDENKIKSILTNKY